MVVCLGQLEGGRTTGGSVTSSRVNKTAYKSSIGEETVLESKYIITLIVMQVVYLACQLHWQGIHVASAHPAPSSFVRLEQRRSRLKTP